MARMSHPEPALGSEAAPPEGFQPLFRTSPFLDLVGPLFWRPEGESFTVGMRVLPRHVNGSGTMHGGLIATLADVSLGYVTAGSRKPPLRMATASLALDYMGAAPLGSWVQARVTIDKIGRHMAFASASIAAEGRPVATARALFAVLEQPSS